MVSLVLASRRFKSCPMQNAAKRVCEARESGRDFGFEYVCCEVSSQAAMAKQRKIKHKCRQTSETLLLLFLTTQKMRSITNRSHVLVLHQVVLHVIFHTGFQIGERGFIALPD